MSMKMIAAVLLCFAGLFGNTQRSVAQEPAALGSSPMPLSSPSSAAYVHESLGMSIIHRRAMFEAEQRMLRTEYNKWIGYNPARPSMNASYLSNSRQLYYIPSRGQFVNAGVARSWYW